MKLKTYIIGLSVALGAMCSSCTDWLDTQPNDKQSEEQQFATKDGFYSAVNGVYNLMAGSSLYGKTLSYEAIDILGQYYTVEQSNQGSYYEYLRALTTWDYNQEDVSSTLSSTWNAAYSTIMNINVVLENIETRGLNAILPQREYQMLKGEMLAARAMIHLDMLRLFGPVYENGPEGRGIPYNDNTDPQILPILTAKDVLENHILKDLKEAEELLLDSDPVVSEGPRAEYDEVNMDNSMRYRQLRLNYYATVLLTARAYLWGGDYEHALAEARKLTDDPKVREFFPAVDQATLLGNYNDPDRMFSTEVLFGYYNKDRGDIYDYTFGGANTGNSLLIPRSGYVSEIMFKGYGADGDDIRLKSQWELGETLDGRQSMKLTKFKEINDQNKNNAESNKEDESGVLKVQKFYGTFCSLVKLSEAYYIAAEAATKTGDLASGWKYLDAVRTSRGCPGYSGNAEMFFWVLLTTEYVREFVGEGQKFFYFKRRNLGFDNDNNGRQEIDVVTPSPLPWFPPSHDYIDHATDEEKAKRFVAPLPESELNNR